MPVNYARLIYSSVSSLNDLPICVPLLLKRLLLIIWRTAVWCMVRCWMLQRLLTDLNIVGV
jgi:hypothetical protein